MKGEEEDRAALRALVESYAVAADAGDGPAFGALFLPDARLTTWPPDGAPGTPRYGADHIGAIPAALRARYEQTDHRLGAHRVVVAEVGNLAVGSLDCEAHHVADGVDRVLIIRYDDTYQHDQDGRWRFCTRDVRVLLVEERPVES